MSLACTSAAAWSLRLTTSDGQLGLSTNAVMRLNHLDTQGREIGVSLRFLNRRSPVHSFPTWYDQTRLARPCNR